MPLFETESLVLKSYSLSEADRIVLFFTREHGLVRGVAKGAKRLKSRFGSTLEPFSTVLLSYFQKENSELASIQNVELIRSSFEQASIPAYLQTFAYMADLLSLFSPPHDPNEKLYRMVKACVEVKVNTIDELAALRLYFEIWLLRLGGFLPNWNACNDCGRLLEPEESTDVQAEFSLLCAGCRRSRSNQAITGGQREVFHQVQRLGPADFLAADSDKVEDVQIVSSILKRVIANVIGKEVVNEKSFAVNF